MKLNALFVLVAASCSAFEIKTGATRHSPKVEEYLPSERTWRFPNADKLRHSELQVPTLQPEDRTWRFPSQNLVGSKNPSSSGRQAYTDADRAGWTTPDPSRIRRPKDSLKAHPSSPEPHVYTNSDRASWTTPDFSKLRHSEDVPTMQSKDRKWRFPDQRLVTDDPSRHHAYTDSDRAGWTTPDPSWLRHSKDPQSMDQFSLDDQAYSKSDRASWTTPDPSRLRHSEDLPDLDSDERLWRNSKLSP